MPFTDKQTAIIAISAIFPPTAAVMAALRFRARTLTAQLIKADDYWILAATIAVTFSMAAYITAAVIACAGTHIRYCTPHQHARFGKVTYAIQFIYLVSIYCVKTSLLLFYKRLFPSRRFGHITLATIVFVSFWLIVFFFAILFQIRPISRNWESTEHVTRRINEEDMNIWLCATNLFAECVIFFLPIPMIANLTMSKKNKIFLLGVFSLGLLTVVSSALRLSYLLRYIRVDKSSDKTYLLADVMIWSLIEPSLGIICACLPLLHPFFKRHSPERIMGAYSKRYVAVNADDLERVPRNPKELENYSERVAHFHEHIIE